MSKKRCSRCRQDLAIDQFTVSRGKPRSWCRPCVSTYNAAYRKANQEKLKDYSREYHRANGDKIRARVGEWVKANPERHQANRTRWKRENPDKVRAERKKNASGYRKRAAAYKKRHPEVVATDNAARRARTRLTREDRVISTAYRKAIHNDRCHYCGQTSEKMHTDHYIPLACGGTDHWWNLVRACEACNIRKWSRMPDDVEQWRLDLLATD